ncbi:MAG: hypothetical protein HZC52_01780 [Planctomycetes bacterium]|nr:hypothetical protein [Planctomycetota bacterium]
MLTILAFGTILFLRKDVILSGSPQAFDTALIAILAALLLMPFFSELSLLGVTIKQQLDETKKEIKQDVKEQIYSMRAEIQNAVNVSNRMNLYVNAPPPDSQLDTLEQQIKPILDDFRKELGIKAQAEPLGDLTPAPEIVYAFSSRYHIENEITRLYNSRFQIRETERERFMGVSKMVDELVRAEIISSPVGRSIREVYSISSAYVHGREPSKEKIAFLQDIVPSLIETLRAIP